MAYVYRVPRRWPDLPFEQRPGTGAERHCSGKQIVAVAGSDRVGRRTAFMLSLIALAKLNDIDPQAWLADVLTRIADIPQRRLGELLP